MAHKTSPNSLIHCASCGEDYSATYRRCPFCGGKNTPLAASGPNPSDDPQSASGRRETSSDLDDTYVFDGQDLFDDKDEDDSASPRSKGGKRLADKPLSNPFANADINWPRVITFICSLVIIVAAMVIVFTWIYPQLRNDKDPVIDNSQSPSSSVEPTGDPTPSTDPSVTEPGVEPTPDAPPVQSNRLTTIFFNRANDVDFTLQPGTSHTIVLKFDPANWSGTVTWTSTDTSIATVDANGKVTNVNTTDKLRKVIITASAEGLRLESTVYCVGVPAASAPPATEAPASNPPASEPPASNPPATQTPSVTVGKKGTVVNAAGGLNVRSGPSVSNAKIGSLKNGDPVNVLEDAGNGWYKISYRGSGGVNVEGYVSGEYISTN